MSKQPESDELLEVKRLWREWTALVERFAMKRRGRRQIPPQHYRTLHAALLKACRSQAAKADELRRPLLEEMERVAGPWVSVEILRGTKQQMLASLLTRALTLQYECEDRKSSRINRSGLALACASVAVVCVVAIVAIFATSSQPVFSADLMGGSGMPWALARAHGLLHQTARAIRWSTFLEKFSVVTVIVVLIGVWWGTHSVRRWS